MSNKTDCIININGRVLKAVNIREKPIELNGFYWDSINSGFCRLPEHRLNDCSENVKALAKGTSGGAFRFKTNSKSIGIMVQLSDTSDMSHMPRSGKSGVDFYIGIKNNKLFYKAIFPELGEKSYEGVFDFDNCELREFTVNLPLYNGIEDIKLLVTPDASIMPPTPYTVEKPVVFYGSSITQGGCASRPGCSYSAILSRWLDFEQINLGFSGSALGESAVAEMIAEIDMSAFVFDYDYNSPDANHLRLTHEQFYKIIREKNRNLPVIMITRSDYNRYPEECEKRLEVIYNTYKNALNRGEHVFFIHGKELFGDYGWDDCTVDTIHPNDIGFLRMAERILPTLKEALKIK